MIPLVVAIERGLAQTIIIAVIVGRRLSRVLINMKLNTLESLITEGDNPVSVSIY